MITQNLDRDWVVSHNWQPALPGTTKVDLPHDGSISMPRRADAASGTSGGFFPGAELCYEKELELPGEGLAVLEFEGVYCNAEVRLNGEIIRINHYGYNGFLVDLSAIARPGVNRLKVNVFANARPDARWYSGAGIYRHVWLHTAPTGCAIKPWGLTVETLSLSQAASLRLRAETVGAPESCALEFVLRNADGEVVYTGREMAAAGETVHEATLPNPLSWSAETPYLYTLQCRLYQNGTLADEATVPFGVRTVALDHARGLLINGRAVKLRGGCVHHDNGILGAASFDRAEERKVELLKASGFNAVRCAHNPPAPSFLRACDRLGMYVMDEAFDVWREGKTPYDYHMFFDADWQKDLDAMVLRDRRHPSVILWSTGNEIVERDGRMNGYHTARQLFDRVKALDTTRPVANCLCQISTLPEQGGLEANLLEQDPAYDLWAERTGPFASFLDVVGYNYLRSRYASDGEKFPARMICGTESFPMEAYDMWQAVDALPYVIGDFVWTAIDYLGESGIGHVWRNGETGFLGEWPWHMAYCGDLDICGNKRPQSYYRDAVWGVDQAPCIAVMPPDRFEKPSVISAWGWPDVALHWDFPGSEGMPAGVEVYSSCTEIALWQDGKLLGRQAVERCKAAFTAVYRPGTLKAVGYRNGIAVCESVLKTARPVKRLRLTSDTPQLSARGEIAYLTVEAVDGEGNRAAQASSSVTVTVTGGRLLALGAADPVSEESYTGPSRHLYQGRLTAVVQTEEPGHTRVTAQCGGMEAAELTL